MALAAVLLLAVAVGALPVRIWLDGRDHASRAADPMRDTSEAGR
jgi:hypothetical protein